MSINDTIEKIEEKEYLEEVLKFVKLVSNRTYKDARNYYDSLDEETKRYIQIHENYKWALKRLSFSSL